MKHKAHCVLSGVLLDMIMVLYKRQGITKGSGSGRGVNEIVKSNSLANSLVVETFDSKPQMSNL